MNYKLKLPDKKINSFDLYTNKKIGNQIQEKLDNLFILIKLCDNNINIGHHSTINQYKQNDLIITFKYTKNINIKIVIQQSKEKFVTGSVSQYYNDGNIKNYNTNNLISMIDFLDEIYKLITNSN